MNNVKIELGTDPIKKIFSHYAIPSVLGMLAMSTAQIVDGIFIGRFVGAEGLAAINLAWPLVMFFSGLSLMFGTGGSTLANIQRGSGNINYANQLYSLTVTLLALLGIFTLIIGLSTLKFIPYFLGADSSIEIMVSDYLRIIIIFAPFFLFTFTLDLFIRGDGSPFFPVVAMIFASVINIVLDYIFVGYLGYGIKGAAFATGISEVFPFVLMAFFLFRRTKWKLSKPVIRGKVILRLMYNGMSEFIDEVSIGASVYIFNLVLMIKIGAMGVAAYSIASYVSEIAGIIFFGTAQAIHPGVSFNKGTGNYDRVKKLKNAALISNFVIGIIAFAVLQLFRNDIARLFVNNLEVISLASEISFYYSFALIFMGINIVISMYFTALDKPLQSALISLSRSLVFLLLGLFFLPLILGDKGIWLSFLFAETGTVLFVYIFLRKTNLSKPSL